MIIIRVSSSEGMMSRLQFTILNYEEREVQDPEKLVCSVLQVRYQHLGQLQSDQPIRD